MYISSLFPGTQIPFTSKMHLQQPTRETMAYRSQFPLLVSWNSGPFPFVLAFSKLHWSWSIFGAQTKLLPNVMSQFLLCCILKVLKRMSTGVSKRHIRKRKRIVEIYVTSNLICKILLIKLGTLNDASYACRSYLKWLLIGQRGLTRASLEHGKEAACTQYHHLGDYKTFLRTHGIDLSQWQFCKH